MQDSPEKSQSKNGAKQVGYRTLPRPLDSKKASLGIQRGGERDH